VQLRQLAALAAVAEEGSFQRAARLLGARALASRLVAIGRREHLAAS